MNIILSPISLIGLSICHSQNPLMNNWLKIIVIFFSFINSFYLFNCYYSDLLTLIIDSLITSIMLYLLEYYPPFKYMTSLVYDFLSIFVSIAFIGFLSGYLIDIIIFIAFFFQISEIIIASLILSAGNSITDYFSNGALAKANEPIMAVMACYSGQIFNNFIGFSINLFIRLQNKDYNFNIFNL